MADKGDRMPKPRYANALSDAEADRVWRLINTEIMVRKAEQAVAVANMRAKVKGRPLRVVPLDATPERLAMVPDAEFVNPATIDSAEQRIGRARRIVAEPLDRLKRVGAITLVQYDAGDWWRNTAQNAGLVHSGRQGYEPRSGDSDPFSRMIPNSARAASARREVRRLGTLLSSDDRRVLDRVCVQGEFGASGRAHGTALVGLRLALDRLAFALKMT